MVLGDQRDGEIRYRLPETIRQYAHDRLEESRETKSLRSRHRDWYLAFAERVEPELIRHDQIEWMDRLEREISNLRVAIEWCLTAGESEEGLRLHKRSGDDRGIALALYATGFVAFAFREVNQAKAAFEDSLALSRKLDYRWGIVNALRMLGNIVRFQEDYERAQTLQEEGLELARKQGDLANVNWLLHDLGLLALQNGDLDRAEGLAQVRSTYFERTGQQAGDRQFISPSRDCADTAEQLCEC